MRFTKVGILFFIAAWGLLPLAAQSLYSPNGTVGPTTTPSNGRVGIGTNAPNAMVDVRGNGMFTGGLSVAYTTSTGANNGLILGTASKATAASGGQGAFQINSNDASNPFQGWMSLVTDSVAANRRLAIGAIEQNVSWRNVTLAESGGNVGIGIANPTSKLHVAGASDTVATFDNASSNNIYLVFRAGGALDAAGEISFQRNGPNDGNWYYGGNATGQHIWRAGGYAYRMVLNGAGNLGVGTASPVARTEITVSGAGLQRNLALTNEQNAADVGSTIEFRNSAYAGATWLGASIQGVRNGASAGHSIVFSTKRNGQGGETISEAMRIFEGNVGIGTANPTQKLSVNGTIRAQEVIVDTGWSDYVFDESYQLSALSEVEKHIKAEKHLPGIPSAKEVAETGISVGEMQAKLLAKIEELTLHVIAQEKRINEQQTTLLDQQKRLSDQQAEIAALRTSAKRDMP